MELYKLKCTIETPLLLLNSVLKVWVWAAETTLGVNENIFISLS